MNEYSVAVLFRIYKMVVTVILSYM